MPLVLFALGATLFNLACEQEPIPPARRRAALALPMQGAYPPTRYVPEQRTAFTDKSLAKLQSLKKNKETRIKELSSSILASLSKFQEQFKKCPKGSVPLVDAEQIARARKLGPELMGENLLHAAAEPLGPSPIAAKEHEPAPKGDSATAASDSGGKDQKKKKLEWYNDRINWGIINLFVSVGVIGAGVVGFIKSKQLFTNEEVANEYKKWKGKKSFREAGGWDGFKKHLTDHHTVDANDVSEVISEAKAHVRSRVGAALKLGTGVAILTSAVLMIDAGANSMGLADGTANADQSALSDKVTQCLANNELRAELYTIQSQQEGIKEELHMINVEIEERSDQDDPK